MTDQPTTRGLLARAADDGPGLRMDDTRLARAFEAVGPAHLRPGGSP